MTVIKNIKTGEVMFEANTETFIEALLMAIAQGVGLANADMRGKDLSGQDFSGVDFNGVNLSCADMRNSNFDNCSFNFANLSAAKMEGASLKMVKILSATTNATQFPEGAAMVQSGSGLPYFYFGETIEIMGFQPEEVSFWADMSEAEALMYGGVRLRDSIDKVRKAISYFTLEYGE